MKRLIILILAISFSTNASESYTMEDLKALDASGSHEEIIKNANTVRPSKRTKEWKTYLTKSFLNVLKDGNANNFEMLKKYPTLSGNKEISKKVSTYT